METWLRFWVGEQIDCDRCLFPGDAPIAEHNEEAIVSSLKLQSDGTVADQAVARFGNKVCKRSCVVVVVVVVVVVGRCCC